MNKWEHHEARPKIWFLNLSFVFQSKGVIAYSKYTLMKEIFDALDFR